MYIYFKRLGDLVSLLQILYRRGYMLQDIVIQAIDQYILVNICGNLANDFTNDQTCIETGAFPKAFCLSNGNHLRTIFIQQLQIQEKPTKNAANRRLSVFAWYQFGGDSRTHARSRVWMDAGGAVVWGRGEEIEPMGQGGRKSGTNRRP